MRYDLCPDVRVMERALTSGELREAAGGDWTYGVVFGDRIHAGSEIYPLMIDAFESDLERHGCHHTRVVGVHKDWLDDYGRARRILFRPRSAAGVEELVEAPVAEPLKIDVVHFLHLPGSRERFFHRELSYRFGNWSIPRVNPYAVSSIADDKMAAYTLLAEDGVPVPRTSLVPSCVSVERVRTLLPSLLRMIRGELIVVKPNEGTEGDGVRTFSRGEDLRILEHVLYLRECGYEATVVQEFRGDIRYGNPDGSGSRSLDLRINVAWDGDEFRAESGYAQVGGDGPFSPASIGQGGSIVNIKHATDCLVLLLGEDEERIPLDAWGLRRIEKAAARAARAINKLSAGRGPLLFMGIDVRLECGRRGGVSPVVLDINPRPAGLGHSRFLDSGWTGNAGVTRGLWQAAEKLLARPYGTKENSLR